MRLWADLWNSSYTFYVNGVPGPIELVSARVGRALDGPGTISVEVAANNARYHEYGALKQVWEIYYDDPIKGEPRFLGAFVVDEVAFSDQTQERLTISGPDTLSLLKNSIATVAKLYDQETISTILNDLENEVTASFSLNFLGSTLSSKVISTRTDGQTVLKAFQQILEREGAHFRLSSTTRREIQIGYFGDAAAVRVDTVEGPAQSLRNNGTLALLQNIQVAQQSSHVVNALLPTGGGVGELFLDLEESTRGRAVSRVENGITRYWLEDSTSIGTYGRIERRLNSDIAAISNAQADIVAAANALSDAGQAKLDRVKDPQTTYSLTAVKVEETIEAGQKLPVYYRGTVYQDGTVTPIETVSGDFWVLRAEEVIDAQGHFVTLDVSNVDAVARDAVQTILGAVDALEIDNIRVQPYPSKAAYGPYYRAVDSTHDATIPVDITDSTLKLTRAYVRITTRPFRATAKSAASVTSSSGGSYSASQTSSSGGGTTTSTAGGGNHYHRMFVIPGFSIPPTSARDYVALDSSGGSPQGVRLETDSSTDLYTYDASGDHTHSITIPSHTHDVSISIPSHTHTIPAANLDYGIVDDTDYPDTVRISVNGVDRTSALGGPWGAGGVAVDEELEISEYINAAATLQQRHTIEISCDSGQGEIEVVVELYEQLSSIKV